MNYSFIKKNVGKSPYEEMAKILECGVAVSEFEIH